MSKSSFLEALRPRQWRGPAFTSRRASRWESTAMEEGDGRIWRYQAANSPDAPGRNAKGEGPPDVS